MKRVVCTLVFPMRNGSVMLGIGKRGVSKGRRNGPGGKQDENETIVECAIRELNEEAGLQAEAEDLEYRGCVTFLWQSDAPGIGVAGAKEVEVHMFALKHWAGEPQESAAMGDYRWYPFNDAPYADMMPGERYWLPAFLMRRMVSGTITYDANANVLAHDIGERRLS